MRFDRACIVCWKLTGHMESLSDGCLYHPTCHDDLLRRIKKTAAQLEECKHNFNGLAEAVDKIINPLSELLDTVPDQVDAADAEGAPSAPAASAVQLSMQLYALNKQLMRLYDTWLTYPPDWEARCREVFRRKGRCEHCGTVDGLNIYHVIPISCGGVHLVENLALLCRGCHERCSDGETFSHMQSAQERAFGRCVRLIQKAISKASLLHFRYADSSGRRSTRTLEPEEMRREGMSLCVYGYCFMRHDYRTFAVKRMRDVRILD